MLPNSDQRLLPKRLSSGASEEVFIGCLDFRTEATLAKTIANVSLLGLPNKSKLAV